VRNPQQAWNGNVEIGLVAMVVSDSGLASANTAVVECLPTWLYSNQRPTMRRMASDAEINTEISTMRKSLNCGTSGVSINVSMGFNHL
jgi:hypothetical protein